MVVTGICRLTNVWHNLARGDSISLDGYKLEIPSEAYFSRKNPEDDLQCVFMIGDYVYYEGDFHGEVWDRIVAHRVKKSKDYRRNIVSRVKNLDSAYGSALSLRQNILMFFSKSALRIRFYPQLNVSQIFRPEDEVFLDAATTRHGKTGNLGYFVTEIRLPKMVRKLPDENSLICQSVLVTTHKGFIGQFYIEGIGFIDHTFVNTDTRNLNPGDRFWLKLYRSSRLADWEVSSCMPDDRLRLSIAGPGISPFDSDKRGPGCPLAAIPEQPDVVQKAAGRSHHSEQDDLKLLLSETLPNSMRQRQFSDSAHTSPLSFSPHRLGTTQLLPSTGISGVAKSASYTSVPVSRGVGSTHSWRSSSVETEIASALSMTDEWIRSREEQVSRPPSRNSAILGTTAPQSSPPQSKAFQPTTRTRQRPQSADLSYMEMQPNDISALVGAQNATGQSVTSTSQGVSPKTRRAASVDPGGGIFSGFRRSFDAIKFSILPTSHSKRTYESEKSLWTPVTIRELRVHGSEPSKRTQTPCSVCCGPKVGDAANVAAQTEQDSGALERILGQLLRDKVTFQVISRRHPQVIKELAVLGLMG